MEFLNDSLKNVFSISYLVYTPAWPCTLARQLSWATIWFRRSTFLILLVSPIWCSLPLATCILYIPDASCAWYFFHWSGSVAFWPLHLFWEYIIRYHGADLPSACVQWDLGCGSDTVDYLLNSDFPYSITTADHFRLILDAGWLGQFFTWFQTIIIVWFSLLIFHRRIYNRWQQLLYIRPSPGG